MAENKSLKTTEVPSQLANLMKAKGNLTTMAQAMKPAATIVDGQHDTEVTATPEKDPTIEPEVIEPEIQEIENTDEVIVEEEIEDTLPQDPETTGGRNYEESWKELKQHYDKKAYEWRQKEEQYQQSLADANKPVLKAPKSDEELAEFQKEHGEAYDVFESLIIKKMQDGGYQEQLGQKLTEVSRLTNEIKGKEAFNDLLKAHPDAESIKTDIRFEKWFNTAPESYKKILTEGIDVPAISKLLTLYKMEALGINPVEKKKAIKKKKVEASLDVPVKGKTEIAPAKKVWTKSEIEGLTYNQWEKVRHEIDDARREGRVDLNK